MRGGGGKRIYLLIHTASFPGPPTLSSRRPYSTGKSWDGGGLRFRGLDRNLVAEPAALGILLRLQVGHFHGGVRGFRGFGSFRFHVGRSLWDAGRAG